MTSRARIHISTVGDQLPRPIHSAAGPPGQPSVDARCPYAERNEPTASNAPKPAKIHPTRLLGCRTAMSPPIPAIVRVKTAYRMLWYAGVDPHPTATAPIT